MILPEPSPRKKPSPLQRESNERFRAASQYASKQINDPESKAEYEAGIRPNKHTAYNVALTDYLNPPKIVYINTKKYSGKVGDLILVKAIDDFKVVSVMVQIFIAGKPIEKGTATPYPRKPKLWRYFATMENPDLLATTVRAIARDKPRNTGVMECPLH